MLLHTIGCVVQFDGFQPHFNSFKMHKIMSIFDFIHPHMSFLSEYVIIVPNNHKSKKKYSTCAWNCSSFSFFFYLIVRHQSVNKLRCHTAFSGMVYILNKEFPAKSLVLIFHWAGTDVTYRHFKGVYVRPRGYDYPSDVIDVIDILCCVGYYIIIMKGAAKGSTYSEQIFQTWKLCVIRG